MNQSSARQRGWRKSVDGYYEFETSRYWSKVYRTTDGRWHVFLKGCHISIGEFADLHSAQDWVAVTIKEHSKRLPRRAAIKLTQLGTPSRVIVESDGYEWKLVSESGSKRRLPPEDELFEYSEVAWTEIERIEAAVMCARSRHEVSNMERLLNDTAPIPSTTPRPSWPVPSNKKHIRSLLTPLEPLTLPTEQEEAQRRVRDSPPA